MSFDTLYVFSTATLLNLVVFVRRRCVMRILVLTISENFRR